MNSRTRRGVKKKPASRKSVVHSDGGERLQKVLARAGVGSRRACEALIEEGRVEVDGKVVTALGTRVDVLQQKIRVDGELKASHRQTYYMVNKPVGVVSTNRDPEGRRRVIDLIHSDLRLFPVGRLDRTSEGLILVTNDGQLANRLTHPRYRVPKTYLVRVVGRISFAEIKQLAHGVHLAEGYAQPESVHIKRHHRQSTDLEIVLREGRNREIRRLLARVGHKVINLCRTAVGSIKLGSLPSGAYRKLTPAEVRKLETMHLHAAEPKNVSKAISGRARKKSSSAARKKTAGGKSATRKKTVSGKSATRRKTAGSKSLSRKKKTGGKSVARKKTAAGRSTDRKVKGSSSRKVKTPRKSKKGQGKVKASQPKGRQRKASSTKKSTRKKRSSKR
ncbi:MAG: pseudouridine synthase [Planctomycetaceae bacterium]|nr:pseudouridine synthase [Planctomycetaceae bacterium]